MEEIGGEGEHCFNQLITLNLTNNVTNYHMPNVSH